MRTATQQRLAELQLEIRVGIHCGEIELRDDDVSGLAVVIAQRIMDTAQGGEILVSSAVKDLVLGSGIPFVTVEERELKGVPGQRADASRRGLTANEAEAERARTMGSGGARR